MQHIIINAWCIPDYDKLTNIFRFVLVFADQGSGEAIFIYKTKPVLKLLHRIFFQKSKGKGFWSTIKCAPSKQWKHKHSGPGSMRLQYCVRMRELILFNVILANIKSMFQATLKSSNVRSQRIQDVLFCLEFNKILGILRKQVLESKIYKIVL